MPWYRRRWVIALAVLALLLAAVAAFALTRTKSANVPAVIDDSVAEARAKIEGAGFEFAQRPAPTCSPQNTVTEQDPAAGREADEGSTVTVTVSLGLTIEVPDVSGLSERDAAQQLKNEQLLVDSQTEVLARRQGGQGDLDHARRRDRRRLPVDRDDARLQGRQPDPPAGPGRFPAGGR